MMIEDKTPVGIRITTSQRAILRQISEDLYDDHDYSGLLEKVCQFAFLEFLREYKDSKKNYELEVHNENLKELRHTIIVDGLPKIQNELTGIEVPIARSFFDKMFKK